MVSNLILKKVFLELKFRKNDLHEDCSLKLLPILSKFNLKKQNNTVKKKTCHFVTYGTFLQTLRCKRVLPRPSLSVGTLHGERLSLPRPSLSVGTLHGESLSWPRPSPSLSVGTLHGEILSGELLFAL